MPDPSPLDFIKPEVRSASAYTLKYLDADVKLDQNENPHEIPDFLKQKVAVRFHEFEWSRYPEFVPARITNTLARFTGWNANGILIGNGSNELIQATMIATLGPGRTIAIPQPTFTLYTLLASAMGATIQTVPLTNTLAFDVEKLIEAARVVDVVIVCSPNNPTGSLLAPKDLERVLVAARGLVIVDEAYHEFSGQTALPLLERFRNLVILRTFSKAMGMAGLRFGYMLTRPELASEIGKVKLPYNVNIFTLTAAEVLVDEAYAMEGAIRALVVERQRLIEELAELEGVEPFPSYANFVLFRTPHAAEAVFQKLYDEGVLVRNVSHYPMLERGLRVTVGTSDQNRRFIDALELGLEQIANGE